MIAIIDYAMGNLGSVKNILKRIGVPSEITNDAQRIRNAQKIILPGVGSFNSGMQNLSKGGLDELLSELVLIEKIPILGICLGAQLMLNGSEEGHCKGLSFVPGNVVKFNNDNSNLRVPHMGWTHVQRLKSCGLTDQLPVEPRFYFVHSYHFKMENKKDELLQSEYIYPFCSAFQQDHIMGVQFHPEKSHKFGMALLRNFTEQV